MLPEKRIFTPRPKRQKGKPQESSQSWLRLWLQKLRRHPVIVGVPSTTAIVAATIGLFSAMDTFRADWASASPSVSPPAVSGDQGALDAPFVITNQSNMLALENATTTCAFDRFEWDKASEVLISEQKLEHPQPGGRIPPSKSVEVDCLVATELRHFSKLDLNGKVKSMRAQITVRYRTLFMPRTFRSPHFCWIPTPSGHLWVICDNLLDFSD